MEIALIAAAASIFTAVIGYVGTYTTSYRLERHRNQLTRVNLQLSQLYGPLHSMTQSNGIAYRTMKARYDPEGLFDQRDAESFARMSLQQRKIYRLWLTTVFQPTSRAARDILLTNTDLLIDGVMPPSALRWFAHVSGYEALLAMWSSGDDSEMFSLVPYPQEFTDYVAHSFDALQKRQRTLLERLGGRRQRATS